MKSILLLQNLRFEENWYDSVESIKNLDEEALRKLNIPLRLIELIRKKLSNQAMAIESVNTKKETSKINSFFSKTPKNKRNSK